MVTVNGTEPAAPGSDGTVTEHVVWSAQEVGAAWPSTAATMFPSALRNPDPLTVTGVPGPPVAGETDVIAGSPPGEGGSVVEVTLALGLSMTGPAPDVGGVVAVG